MKSKVGFTIFNKSVIVAIGLLVIQQLIVASSTLWITKLIGSVQKGAFSFLLLGLFLASLFLPYFPGAAALIQIAKAKLLAQFDFVNRFIFLYTGNVFEWPFASHHNKKISTLSAETPRVIDSYIDFIYQLSSSALNVSLNLLALAIIVEPYFLVSYAMGISLAYVILILQKKWKRTLAFRTQQSRLNWVGMLLKIWDHVLINNNYNFHIWKRKAYSRRERLIKSTLKLERFNQIISISMAFVLLTPSFALVCFLAYKRRDDLLYLGMLVVILPRLFQVLGYSYETLFALSSFPMEKAQLQTTLKLIDQKQIELTTNGKKKLENRIDWDRITANDQSALSLLDELPNHGKITLKGENGSGKTSLLLFLKQKYGAEAFYLPAKHNLLFHVSEEQLSTGQRSRKILEEIVSHVEASIILLDEWDANLDAENASKLSGMINTLAKSKCVIESLHVKNKM